MVEEVILSYIRFAEEVMPGMMEALEDGEVWGFAVNIIISLKDKTT